MRAEDHFLHDLAHAFAGFSAPHPAVPTLRHRDRSGRLNRDGDLRQQFAWIASRQPAEEGTCGSVQPHRRDHCLGPGGNKSGTVVDLHQASGDGDPPFREDHHRAAGLDQPDHALHRHRVGGVYRQIITQTQHQPEKPNAGHLGVHHKYRIDREKRPQDQSVEEELVIGDDEQPRLGKMARVPFYLDAKQHPKQPSDNGLEHDGFPRRSRLQLKAGYCTQPYSVADLAMLRASASRRRRLRNARL